MSDQVDQQIISWGQEALRTEAMAIERVASRLGESFTKAVKTMVEVQGKVVLTGLGKSGHVARKIASTLSSTGTSAFYLHPTEALHGDFGMLQSTDCLVALAFGGETAEVVEVAKYARRIGVPIIVITGKTTSTLATLANMVLDGGVDREADAFNLAPTSSSTVALALGDALAVTLMRLRGFNDKDFASLHPGGSLGRKLSVVKDHMHAIKDVPCIAGEVNFHEVLEAVTRYNFGIVAIVDEREQLSGAISDGDLRRALLHSGADTLRQKAKDLMTLSPKTIPQHALAIDALRIMNEKQITQLFVVSGSEANKLVGLVRMHDLLAAKIV